MSISKADKSELVAEYARSEGDTGSVEVQVAVLTTRIKNLTEHLKRHQKDVSTRRGLIGLVAQRRKLLNYLQASESARYRALVEKLDLRH